MNNMNTMHKITTVKELEKYIGKLIVTKIGKAQGDGATHSLRILTRIYCPHFYDQSMQYEDKPLMPYKIYGKHVMRLDENGKFVSSFGFERFASEFQTYTSSTIYARLPTTEEKHLYMEQLAKAKLRR